MKRNSGFVLVGMPVGSKRESSAFTLIELLVVVAIVTLLVTIIMPTLGRALVLARRAICGTNLASAVKGMALYGTENNAKFPNRGYRDTTRFDVIGADLKNDPDSANSNSRNLFLAVRLGFINPDLLNCPATEDEPVDLTNSDGDIYYDFNCGTGSSYKSKLSYSYHLQFLSHEGGPRGYPLLQKSSADMA
ncbi:hypothetical protein LCGC14_2575730, partial [marine sediment metagenome]